MLKEFQKLGDKIIYRDANKPGFEKLAAHLQYWAAPRNQSNCLVGDVTLLATTVFICFIIFICLIIVSYTLGAGEVISNMSSFSVCRRQKKDLLSFVAHKKITAAKRSVQTACLTTNTPWRLNPWSPATVGIVHWYLSLYLEWDLQQVTNFNLQMQRFLHQHLPKVRNWDSWSLLPIHLHCWDSSENSTNGEKPLGSAIMPSDEQRLWGENMGVCYENDSS